MTTSLNVSTIATNMS